MIDVNDLRRGVTFTLENQLYEVVEYSHNKPGRGNATIRVKCYNLRSGTNTEKTFQSGDRVQDIRLEHRPMQYLYNDGTFHHFMDTETFEQIALSSDALGEKAHYLRENLECKITFHDTEALNLELPASVDLKVVESEAGVRGDTATGANKLATVETGMKVQVPLFVKVGDTIKVDTREGNYITRVN